MSERCTCPPEPPTIYRARRSASGRRLPSACWHAHRDVFRAIYAEHPGAKIRTALATYEGAEHFERTFPATADQNVGSTLYPVTFGSLCECEGVA